MGKRAIVLAARERKPSMIRSALFDIDETLYRLAPAHAAR